MRVVVLRVYPGRCTEGKRNWLAEEKEEVENVGVVCRDGRERRFTWYFLVT